MSGRAPKSKKQAPPKKSKPRPSKAAEEEFNPLSRQSLAISVASQLTARELIPLARLPRTKVRGAGLYALYYSGPLDIYAPLVTCNEKIEEISNGKNRRLRPIYVGRAMPGSSSTGSRKVTGDELKKRLSDHRQSIIDAKNLDIKHFKFRFLPVADLFIALGEDILIKDYRPVWNAVVKGFGNHDPGVKGRESQTCSPWDAIHPGRPFSYARRIEKGDELKGEKDVICFVADESTGEKIAKVPKESLDKLETKVKKHFENHLTLDATELDELAAKGQAPKVSAEIAFNAVLVDEDEADNAAAAPS